jgi:hypothetical protein
VYNCFRDFALGMDDDFCQESGGEAAQSSSSSRRRRSGATWWAHGAALARGPAPEQPELLTATMLFPPGEREASAAVRAEVGEGMAAALALARGGPLPDLSADGGRPGGGVGLQVGAGGRDYDESDVARFRAHYDAVGREAAGAVEGRVAAPPASTATNPSGRPRPGDFYSPESAAALASLRVFRFGLMEMTRHRSRRNAALARDPAAGWGQGVVAM